MLGSALFDTLAEADLGENPFVKDMPGYAIPSFRFSNAMKQQMMQCDVEINLRFHWRSPLSANEKKTEFA